MCTMFQTHKCMYYKEMFILHVCVLKAIPTSCLCHNAIIGYTLAIEVSTI